MRWKLTLIAPFIGTLGAAVSWLIAVFVIIHNTNQSAFYILLFQIIDLGVLLGWAIASGWFAYRHTAKRRRLQALMVALLTLTLTIATIRIIDYYWHDQLFFTILKVPDYIEP